LCKEDEALVLIHCKVLKGIPEVTLQHLPCKVEADDAASISSFFCPKTVKGENKIETLSATFRGRPLDGKNINLPEGYVGVVMAEKQEPYSEDEKRTFDVVGKFNGFTKWYLGSQFASGIQWIKLA
uniref:Uncharacterized protein n=1 Tax=Ciona savignyi TaxID=51511 RepID=H2YKZ0_CIOSA